MNSMAQRIWPRTNLGLAAALSFAKTPAGFKIIKIPQRRVTCYLDKFRRRTQLLRSTRVANHAVRNCVSLPQNGSTTEPPTVKSPRFLRFAHLRADSGAT